MTYNAKQIANELFDTACGIAFYGKALRVAKDSPVVTDDDRAVLNRYAAGLNAGPDYIRLQEIAIKIHHHAL